MQPAVIEVTDVGKRYRLGGNAAPYATVRESLMSAAALPARTMRRAGGGSTVPGRRPEFWALRNVSFEVRQGDVLGVIGRNGAGKSTLLKILSRITEPTEGRVRLRGHVASLLEVGTGFHPELTGRENIFLNGSILGMPRVDIVRKLDEIVSFAEVDRFVDTAVKYYSSGMYLRLAFAVAAHLEPEILLVDEVLAVGDFAFQKKCIGKMEEVADRGRTVMVVSHHMPTIAQLCTRVLWLKEGSLVREGPPDAVIAAYLTAGEGARATWTATPSPDQHGFHIYEASVRSESGEVAAEVGFDQDLSIRIEYELARPLEDLHLFVRLIDAYGNAVFTSWESDADALRTPTRAPGRYVASCRIPARLLRPGLYAATVGAHMGVDSIQVQERALTFNVTHDGYHLNSGRVGVITPILEWRSRDAVASR